MTNKERDQMEREAAATMQTHDPRDVETMARLLCEADGKGNLPAIYERLSHDMLDALQSKGLKIVGRRIPEIPGSAWSSIARQGWTEAHDAAPICPRGAP